MGPSLIKHSTGYICSSCRESWLLYARTSILDARSKRPVGSSVPHSKLLHRDAYSSKSLKPLLTIQNGPRIQHDPAQQPKFARKSTSHGLDASRFRHYLENFGLKSSGPGVSTDANRASQILHQTVQRGGDTPVSDSSPPHSLLQARAKASSRIKSSKIGVQKSPNTVTLLRDVHRWINGQSKSTRTPAVSIDTLAKHRLVRDDDWAAVIWMLVAARLKDDRVIQSQGEAESKVQDDAALDDAIIEYWKVYFHAHRPSPIQGERRVMRPNDWSCIPHVAELEDLGSSLPRQFHQRLHHHFPRIPDQEIQSIALAAFTTFHVLSPQQARAEALHSRLTVASRPFQEFVGRLLMFSEVTSISDLLASKLPTHVAAELTRSWRQPTSLAATVLGTTPQPITSTDGRARNNRDKTCVEADGFLKMVDGALERRQRQYAEQLWLEIRQWYRTFKSGGSPTSELRSPSSGGDHATEMIGKVLDRCIMTFMALRLPDNAVDVWNEMVAGGDKPAQSSWHAMLDGNRRARNVRGIEDVWRSMRAAGVRPDVGCWTTRISGLISCGKVAFGIQALNEMCQDWEAAAKMWKREDKDRKNDLAGLGDVRGIVKPTTITINAALSALSRQGKAALSGDVTYWAHRFGIQYDIITFNALLNIAMRHGRREQAFQLLRDMEASGVLPDRATMTIILDGLFRIASSSSTPSEGRSQTAAPTSSLLPFNVQAILSDMDAYGISANEHTYAMLVDRLLKQHNDVAAAQTVLDHMYARGMQPTPHMSTSLVSHHFNQRPPNLDAVQRVWDRIYTAGSGAVDHILYDRTIEGYAGAGQIAAMLDKLDAMEARGMVPGWDTLTIVLHALARSGDTNRARKIVEQVKTRQKQTSRAHGGSVTPGERRLWIEVGHLTGTLR
ncbi:MAG: hypothetical protein M1825_004563 [Sarcosagium campestre]|nr:MAG: hypothetical protein M1825_004563 [Sarcosagium campestre]